ncbi:STM4014 family protein [Nocardia sp. NPDC127579]|uniref:STM4014 family protein n=1 Tax=Nocardia sp. NPDC127579 TaxID=3345402 RepID=UPI003624FBAD
MNALAVVGIPNNRRVTGFQDAVRRAGLAPARVVSWLDVLEGRAEFHPGELVRLDSPGEDAQVDRLLRDTTDPTRVEGSALWYRRFLAAARSLRSARGVDAGSWSEPRLLDDPEDLAVLFDKRLCHGVLTNADVPVPISPTSGPGAPVIGGWDDVRAAGLSRVFVKLAHGSSASGVLAIAMAGGGRVRATTSVRRAGDGGLFNSLRVATYSTESEVAALVDALAPDGLHLERWLPKASLHGRTADLRVVVVDGRATHAVARTSRWPMTNLHLGGARGDLGVARAIMGDGWSRAVEICERAAACFPGFSRVGVDLLPGPGWRRFVVGEVNAFGDLLPGLRGFDGGGAEFQDAYEAQVAAILRRTRSTADV